MLRAIEYVSAAVLAVDVLVVFVSVVCRYFLHDPLDWTEEVASALMIVLCVFGAATVLGAASTSASTCFAARSPRAGRAHSCRSATGSSRPSR